MDKKNTTIGVLLILAAFASVLYFAPKPTPPPAGGSTTPPAAAVTGVPLPEAAAPLSAASANTTAATPLPATAPAPVSDLAAVARDSADATITTLANDYVEVRLTDFGGAIRDVAMKKYLAVQGEPAPFVFNQAHADPILAFTADSFPGLDSKLHFERVSATATEVVYRAVFENRLEVTRRYTIHAPGDASGDPYRISHETTFRNLTKETAPLPRAAVSLGTTALLGPSDYGLYLNVASDDGKETQLIDRGDLQGGGLFNALGIRNNPPKAVIENTTSVQWGAVKNQFFASILTLEKPGTAIIARRVDFGATTTGLPNVGITGAVRLELPVLAPGATAGFKGDLYVGPKEYTRLAKFDHNEDRVMQFTRNFYTRMFLSGYVAPAMNTLLKALHSVVGNWGLAIVLMTLLLKLISLPFTLKASRSAKAMQKLQPLMVGIREKYKDNPQKLNQATMELFKEHKVNPMGGCLPVLITIPLFVGFFAMLQSTAELRFQGFLWVHDLSAPDTVGHVMGFPINIMPLLMAAAMVFQMRLTPQPTVDNAQVKMMRFMPYMVALFCYSFSCALALYSTINGLFTICQQLLVNKYTKDETPAVTTGPGGRPLKNVTPRKK